MRKAILAAVFLALCPLLIAQQALSNDAVIKLVKSGMSDDLILVAINAQPGSYDTSADGLIALKSAGVSDKVVAAIVLKAAANPAPTALAPAPAAVPAPVPEPAPAPPVVPAVTPAPPVAAEPSRPPGIDVAGVYYKEQSGAWTPIPPEIVTARAGFSVGESKVGSVKGHILGGKAKVSAALPVTLAVYLPEGRTISEYRLMRLVAKTSEREFHISSSLVSKESNDNEIDKDAVVITSEKIGPGVYQITLSSSLGRGEYGMLAPKPRDDAEGSNWKIYCLSAGN